MSLEKLSLEGEDPLSVIHHILSEEPDPHTYRLLFNGVDGAGIVRDWTPLMLLWNRSNALLSKKREALKLLLFHGVDMNLTGGLGLNSLHLLVLRLACSSTDKESLETVGDMEWWLRMGADPTTKVFLPRSNNVVLDVLSPIEFFILLGRDSTLLPRGLEKFFTRNQNMKLSEDCQRLFYYTMLCFDAEAPSSAYREDAIYTECAELLVKDVTNKMLREHSLLRQKLRDHYKLPADHDNTLEERHRVLKKKFLKCSLKRIEAPSSSAVFIHTASCEHDGETPLEQYYSVVVGNGNVSSFHPEMIARLLRDDRNPCTNTPFHPDTRWEWIRRLEDGDPCFPYHSLEENKALFPRLFHTPEKPCETRMLLEKLNELICRAHPFTNIMLLQNYEDYRLSYLCSVLEGETYQLTEVKDAEDLQGLLKALLICIYKDRDRIAAIHFAIEEAHEDLLLYDAVCAYLEKNKTSFIFSFYEAITHLELFRLVSVRVGYSSLMEMALVWYKMSSIYTFKHSGSEFSEQGIIVIHHDSEEGEFEPIIDDDIIIEDDGEEDTDSRHNHFPIIILSESSDESSDSSTETTPP